MKNFINLSTKLKAEDIKRYKDAIQGLRNVIERREADTMANDKYTEALRDMVCKLERKIGIKRQVQVQTLPSTQELQPAQVLPSTQFTFVQSAAL